jgi:sugar lactone lactonase YvrE
LAFDPARSILYVTDPDAGRVLVYDGQGNCIGSFGQPTDRAVGLTDFQVAAGIAVGPDGTVYVSDSDAGRILQFPPFTDFAATIPQDPAVSGALEQVIVGLGDSADSGEAGAAEVTPEATPAE